MRGDVDVGPGGVPRDLDAVGENGGGGVGPARTAVLGNVLVPDVRQVVCLVDFIPEHLGWWRSVLGVVASSSVADHSNVFGLHEARALGVDTQAFVCLRDTK